MGEDTVIGSVGGSASPHLKHLVMADAYLPHSGGSRVYYSNLYTNLLAQSSDEVTVLTKKVPGWREFDAATSSQRYRIKRLFRPLPSWRYAQLPKFILPFFHGLGALLAGDYDILHCGDLFPQALNGVLLRALFRVPLIVFCHGDEVSQTGKRRLQPRIRNFVYRNADIVVAANEFARQGLLRAGIPENRIHKLTPGVDLTHFHRQPPNKELIAQYRLEGKKVLLTVARLVPRKGHKVVLQALPKVREEIPNIHYLIAGDGPEREHLQQIARELNIEDAVTFTGDIPHDKIAQFYNLCDVFIMVNRQEKGGDIETFGMVFTEANAVGKAVIGGDSGGTAEAILEGRTGFRVSPDDPEQVADRLLRLFKNDELRAQMGATGVARTLSEFNWGDRARGFREVCLDQIMRTKPRKQSAALAAAQNSKAAL